MSARETLVIPNGRVDSTPPIPPEKSREIAMSPFASAAIRSSSRARSRARFSRSKTPRRYRRSPALRENARGEDDRSGAPEKESPPHEAIGVLEPDASALCDEKRRAGATPPGAERRDSRNSRAARRRSTVASSARARLAATRARSFLLSAASTDLEVALKSPRALNPLRLETAPRGLSGSSSRRDPPPPPQAGRARLGDVEADAEAGSFHAAYLDAAATVLGIADAVLLGRMTSRGIAVGGSKEPPPRSTGARSRGGAVRGAVDAKRESPPSAESSSPNAPNSDRDCLKSAARLPSSYVRHFGVDAASACCGTYLCAFAGGGAHASGSASGGSSVSSRRRTASSRGWSDGNPSMPNVANTRTSSYSLDDSRASFGAKKRG